MAPARPQRTEEDDNVLEIPEIHWPVFQVFQACDTQWHTGFEGRTGMIHSEVRTTAREDFGIADTGSLMSRIRVIESAYLAEVNRQRAIARASN